MKLEYGKIKGLDGYVFVLSDGKKIKAVYPFLCKKISLEFAVKYLREKGITLKPKKADLNWILELMQGLKKTDISCFDLSDATTFQKNVYKKLCSTAPGTVLSYGELSSDRARAVGTAMKKNPLPLLIPCHRVTSKNGAEHYTISCYNKRPAACRTKDPDSCSKAIKKNLRKKEADE